MKVVTDKKITSKEVIDLQNKPTTQEEDTKLVEAFVKDKENKKRAGEMAFQILTDFPNWFKVSQLVKKYKTSQEEVAKKLEMLMLFNLCVGKVVKNQGLFKIDLTQKVQRDLILQQISEKEGEILFLKEKLSKLD